MLFLLLLFSTVISAVELIVSSNHLIADAFQIAEYKGKYISLIDTDFVYITNENDEYVVSENTNLTITEYVGTELWNLDSLDGVIDQNYNYIYTGNNVTAYIIDSGITPGPEFGNRLKPGISFNPYNSSTIDCIGHGTHVASLLGSNTYGVAKNVNIVPVKVFDCTTTTYLGSVLQAIYWVIKQPKGIVNLSLGGSYNSIMNEAVKALVDSGFIVVVSAGNEGANTCDYSPSSETSVIVAGCTTRTNSVCSYSNEGTCITLFAPGDYILGLSNVLGKTVYKSGTSMSSPHVAGIAATLYEKFPGILQQDMKNILIDIAANNTLNTFKILSSPNLELREFKEYPVPRCNLVKPTMCLHTPLCSYILRYGCRLYNFCGFRTKHECLLRKHCKYEKGKCTLKNEK
jgi:subtilisin family serine protease